MESLSRTLHAARRDQGKTSCANCNRIDYNFGRAHEPFDLQIGERKKPVSHRRLDFISLLLHIIELNWIYVRRSGSRHNEMNTNDAM